MSSAPSRRGWLTPILIGVIAAVLLATSIMLASKGSGGDPGAEPSGETPAQQPAGEVVAPEAPQTLDMARLEPDDPLAVGPLDAPVTLVVYSDYQCPYCAQWATATGPAMLDYAEAGRLRIEYRDITLFGDESERAAIAAYAAGLQGNYTDFHEALFAGGDTRSPNELSEDALIALAGDLGLDTDEFAVDLTSEAAAQAVLRNNEE